MSITPVFVLSIPRSGSTLVQRVLAAHDGVATTAEPWLLLPLLVPLASNHAMADAWQTEIAKAVEDFAQALPGGEREMLEATRAHATRLYERAAGPHAQFFVDKTPHYYLITDVLLRTFPDARFVFLWRNPLSVIASLVDTFGGGRWCPAKFRLQLFHGLSRLVATYKNNPDRGHAVRYEDLLADDTSAWDALMGNIGMRFDPAALEGFRSVRLDGRFKDPNAALYRGLSRAPLDKYQATLASPIRQAWCRRYLHWLGAGRLSAMGYDLEELLASLDRIPRRFDTVGSDLFELGHGAAREAWRARMPGNRLISSTRALARSG